MFEPAHKSLPPVDYVSMIRSLYGDRRSQLLGAFGSPNFDGGHGRYAYYDTEPALGVQIELLEWNADMEPQPK